MARDHLDPYDVLGVARDASAADVARAYRRAARATHPDSSADAASAHGFHAVSDAYETLRDPGRRAAYDRASAWPAPLAPAGRHIVLGAPPDASATLARIVLSLLRRG